MSDAQNEPTDSGMCKGKDGNKTAAGILLRERDDARRERDEMKMSIEDMGKIADNEREGRLHAEAEAALLREALAQADEHMCCDEDGAYHDDIREGKRGPCPGCAAEIAVNMALRERAPLAAAAARVIAAAKEMHGSHRAAGKHDRCNLCTAVDALEKARRGE